MTKTKKMELVSTEESKSFKKKRMLEVRAAVANALKHNQRVDELGFTGTDIPRVMIALQDEVMRARDRHSKATKHIAVSRNNVQNIMPIIGAVVINQVMTINEMAAQLDAAYAELFMSQNQTAMLDSALQDAQATIRTLR